MMAAKRKTPPTGDPVAREAPRRRVHGATAGAGDPSRDTPAVIGRVVREAHGPGARVEGRVILEDPGSSARA